MSEAERDDERDQPGGEVVPFPGARAVPEVAPDAALEPVPDALDGELVSDEEYARRTGLHRYTPIRVVHLVTVVRESEHTTGAGRAVLRAGLTVGQGVGPGPGAASTRPRSACTGGRSPKRRRRVTRNGWPTGPPGPNMLGNGATGG